VKSERKSEKKKMGERLGGVVEDSDKLEGRIKRC